MKKYLVDLGAGALAGGVCFFLGFIATLFSSDVRVYLALSAILIAAGIWRYHRSRFGWKQHGTLIFAFAAIFAYLAVFASALLIAFSRWQPFL